MSSKGKESHRMNAHSEQEQMITAQYRYIKELAIMKYNAEEQREQNLVQQSSQMQTAFSFMTAAIFMALPICIEYRGALSLTFFFVSTSFSLGNILKLPGEKSPEEILYEYLLSLGPDHDFWSSGAQLVGLTWDYFNEHGPKSDDYKQEKDREKYKKWFIDHQQLFESTKLMDFWKEDNPQLVQKFREDFRTAHNHIAKRTMSIPIKE